MYLIFVSIVALLLLLVSIGCSRPDAKHRHPHEMASEEDSSQAHIRKHLRLLAQTSAPQSLIPRGTCYIQALPPNRVEYACPECGNKTLYANPEGKRDSNVRFIARELQACRRLVSQIQGLNAKLDESSFCKSCTPDAGKRELVLVVEYKDTGKIHTVHGIQLDDLQLLVEFSAGKLVHDMGLGGERPLKEFLICLEELLGVSLNDD